MLANIHDEKLVNLPPFFNRINSWRQTTTEFTGIRDPG